MKQYLDFKNIPDWEPLSVCIYKIWAISKKMKSKRDIRSQKLFLTDACILYLFDKWNHSSS